MTRPHNTRYITGLFYEFVSAKKFFLQDSFVARVPFMFIVTSFLSQKRIIVSENIDSKVGKLIQERGFVRDRKSRIAFFWRSRSRIEKLNVQRDSSVSKSRSRNLWLVQSETTDSYNKCAEHSVIFFRVFNTSLKIQLNLIQLFLTIARVRMDLVRFCGHLSSNY